MVFEKYGVDLLLSDKLNQDPIEEYFRCIRGVGRVSDKTDRVLI